VMAESESHRGRRFRCGFGFNNGSDSGILLAEPSPSLDFADGILPGGVTVARVTLDHLVLVRIQAGQCGLSKLPQWLTAIIAAREKWRFDPALPQYHFKRQ
jgi:hypothetical protein